MATAAQTLETFDQLPPADQKKVAAEIVVRALGDPSAKTTDNLWYIVVSTFSALVLGGLLVLLILILKGKATDVVAPLVTLGAGVLGGLLAPTPTKK